jgi:lysozyme
MGRVLGHDVSHWQPPGQGLAASCRNAGGRYVWLKSSQGQSQRDAAMDGHRSAFAGVPRGAYHFLDFSGATGEAANFLAATAGRAWEMPHVLDAEQRNAGNPRQTADYLLRMLDIIERATGRTPMIYTGPGWWQPSVTPDPRFARYPLWLARYPNAYAGGNTPPDSAGVPSIAPWANWSVWQFSSANGLDRNVCAPEVLAMLTGGTSPIPSPAPNQEPPLMSAQVDQINEYTRLIVNDAVGKLQTNLKDSLGWVPGGKSMAQVVQDAANGEIVFIATLLKDTEGRIDASVAATLTARLAELRQLAGK